jgi:very-short-patch-repair endonuclease
MSHDFHLQPHISAQGETRELDAAIATLATRQEGVVGHAQLMAIGLTRHEIGDRIRAKRLHRLHRGVYAVGHRRLTRAGRYMAAVLAAGEGAVLSHRAAAGLWELRTPREGRIEVIAPCHRRGDRDLQIRQCALAPDEVTTRQGIPVTTPARTIIDLASCVPKHLSQSELERAIRQAVYLRLTSTALLVDAVERHAGRRGMKKLRQALVHLGEAPGITRSTLEQRFLRFLRKHNLPIPELNVEMEVFGRQIEADCVWRQQRVIVELDGRDGHDSTPAFESDRARDSAVQAARWRVVRVTSARMRTDGDRLATELRALVAA